MKPLQFEQVSYYLFLFYACLYTVYLCDNSDYFSLPTFTYIDIFRIHVFNKYNFLREN